MKLKLNLFGKLNILLIWFYFSGEGCEACDCDPVGSVGPSCDSYVGQCDCRYIYLNINKNF